MKRTALSLVAAGLVAALTACGTTEAPTAGTPGTSPAAAGYEGPVSVADSRGKTITLQQAASRVVVLEWGEAEIVASLGVTPVGVADVKGYGTWDAAAPLDASVKDVGTRGEPSIDAVLGLGPDLVIAIEDLPATVVSQLESSVPVFVADATDASRNLDRLRDEVTALGTLLGKTDESKKVVGEMDAALAAGKTAIADAGGAGTPFVMADGWKEGSSGRPASLRHGLAGLRDRRGARPRQRLERRGRQGVGPRADRRRGHDGRHRPQDSPVLQRIRGRRLRQ